MNNTYTAVVKQDGDWWIGWIEEVPGMNCQELTHEELLKSIRLTLQEALEAVDAEQSPDGKTWQDQAIAHSNAILAVSRYNQIRKECNSRSPLNAKVILPPNLPTI